MAEKRRDTRKFDLEKSTYSWKITCIYEGKQTNILKINLGNNST